MTTTPTTIQELLDYWPGNIPFKGSLVSEDGTCMCAQGQALHFLDGLTVDELRKIHQTVADKRIAKLFGISLAHSILLRLVNDGREGAPSCVIRNPEQVLGDQAHVVLAFWRHLDKMNSADWKAVRAAAKTAPWGGAAWEVARAAARVSREAASLAREAAGSAAMQAVRSAAMREAGWKAAGVAAGASNEIQGAAFMRANNQQFFFLPLFGFPSPEAVIVSTEQEAIR